MAKKKKVEEKPQIVVQPQPMWSDKLHVQTTVKK